MKITSFSQSALGLPEDLTKKILLDLGAELLQEVVMFLDTSWVRLWVATADQPVMLSLVKKPSDTGGGFAIGGAPVTSEVLGIALIDTPTQANELQGRIWIPSKCGACAAAEAALTVALEEVAVPWGAGIEIVSNR
jgi:hypothetical protein